MQKTLKKEALETGWHLGVCVLFFPVVAKRILVNQWYVRFCFGTMVVGLLYHIHLVTMILNRINKRKTF